MARLLPGLGSPSFTKVNHCSTAFGPRFTAFDRQRVDYSRAGDLAGSKFDTVTLGGVLGTGVPTISGFRYGPKGKKKNTGGDKRRVVVEVSGVTVVNEDELDPLGIPQRIINPSSAEYPKDAQGDLSTHLDQGEDLEEALDIYSALENQPRTGCVNMLMEMCRSKMGTAKATAFGGVSTFHHAEYPKDEESFFGRRGGLVKACLSATARLLSTISTSLGNKGQRQLQ